MSAQTRIEWCDSTFNPWIGCTKVSPACDNCYAAVSTPARTRGIEWGAGKPRQRTSESNWHQPVKWNGKEFFQCVSCGWRGEYMMQHQKDCAAGAREMFATRRRVFCSSLADVFDNEVDPQWRRDLFDLIANTPNLDWLLLTKRIGNVPAMLNEVERRRQGYEANQYVACIGWLPSNVWLGATICNQTEADRDVPKLLQVSAAVRFLSIEPMLGPIDLEQLPSHSGIGRHLSAFGPEDKHADVPGAVNWVICGGESGHNARPMHPEWVRSLRDQCEGAGVPFLFKQWGEWVDADNGPSDDAAYDGKADCWVDLDGSVHDGELGVDFFGGTWPVYRVGKKKAGNLLDGRQHLEWPATGGAA